MPYAARCLALLSILALALPLVQMTPTAQASHSGIRTVDAFAFSPSFPNRNVSYNTSGSTSWGANDNWRSGITTFGDATNLGQTVSQGSSGCSGAGPANRNGELTIWFTKQTGQHPKVNFSALDTRWLDGISIRADIDSSGSTTACGYVYLMTATTTGGNPANGSFTETETFVAKCGKLGGGNAANGNAQQVCNLPFSNQPISGIRIVCQSGYSSYVPTCKLNEITGSGVDPTPPTEQPALTVTPQGCTNNAAWTTTTDTTQYKLYRADGPGFDYKTLTPIATVAHPGGGYTDTGLGSGKSYYYQVVPTNGDGDGPASAIVDGTAGVCDGTGLGVIGADGHMGPNVLTHYGASNRYTTAGQWSITSNGGGHTFGCTDVGELGNLYIPCATDGVSGTYVNLNSISTYARSSDCKAPGGYVEWTFSAQRVQSFYARVRPYNEGSTTGGNTSAMCVEAQYRRASDGVWTTATTFTALSNQTDANLWHNLTSAVNATGVRWYVGDKGTGTGKGGFLLYETDVYDKNATYYHMETSLRDLMAGYAAPVTGTWSYGTFYTKDFTLYGGTWKVLLPVPYDSTTGRFYNWQFNALGADWSSQTNSLGPRIVSWENANGGQTCAVGVYTVTITGGARQFNASVNGVNSGTVFCRVTGSSFIPSAYQPASQGYKVQADWSKRTCGGVPCGTGELAGVYYQATGFPWFPMIDEDFSDASIIVQANFTPGAKIFANGSIGSLATVSLASYKYQFFGNGLFIALGQAQSSSQTFSSTQWEIMLNGRPASVIHNSYFAGYQVAIFYIDDQAARRGLDNHDGVTTQGNRREHGQVYETYQIQLLKGFDPSKDVRLMRSFGMEGHGGMTCRDFCSANVDLSFYKTPPENQNRLLWTVRDSKNNPMAGVRVTNNVTGQFAFTNSLGQVELFDVYTDTRFVFALSGYYTKCVGYQYQSLQGQQLSTIEQPCGGSDAYPSIRAQNLEYTVILYATGITNEQGQGSFNEVPVEVVTKPVQGIVFRGNLTRIAPDQVNIQVQRNVSEDLKLTVFRFNSRTGTLSRVTDVLDWPSNSNANPLLVVYPGGRTTDESDEGGYHLMVQRGSSYVTGVNFKVLANWTNLHAIAVPGDVSGIGDGLAEQVTHEDEAQQEASHQEALQQAAESVDTGSALSEAVWIVPVILILLFVGLLLRAMT